MAWVDYATLYPINIFNFDLSVKIILINLERKAKEKDFRKKLVYPSKAVG